MSGKRQYQTEELAVWGAEKNKAQVVDPQKEKEKLDNERIISDHKGSTSKKGNKRNHVTKIWNSFRKGNLNLVPSV